LSVGVTEVTVLLSELTPTKVKGAENSEGKIGKIRSKHNIYLKNSEGNGSFRMSMSISI
jgi:hypothetical protein